MGWAWDDQLGVPRSNIEGVDRVMSNINRYLSRLNGVTMNRLIKCAALVRWETEKGTLLTPVDYGNLRASWFVVTASGRLARGGGKEHTAQGHGAAFKGPGGAEVAGQHTATMAKMQVKAKALSTIYGGPFLIMGYSANYSMWVHEMIGVVGRRSKDNPRGWSRPGSGPKWFEAALNKHRRNIIKIASGGVDMNIKGFTV